MKVENRRQKILNKLATAQTPISASRLAEEFGVSRQIIVKDISELRASGYRITALARGYILEQSLRCKRVFKVLHSDDDVEKELNLIVDLGGMVEDVFIYHKFYNQIKAPMHIQSRDDVAHFMQSVTEGNSSLLKNVTSGYHYHTVTAENAETLDRIEEALQAQSFLAPLQEHEPTELFKD